MKKLILFFSTILLMSSCGINHTPYSNEPVTTQVNLKHANYRIVKQVDGFASANYVLGIGGLSKKSLEGNAIADMYQKAELVGNQQIINITTTQSVKVILIYVKRQICAHGYVIEFIDGNQEIEIPENINENTTAETDNQQYSQLESIEKKHQRLMKAAKTYSLSTTMPFKAYERLYKFYTIDNVEENLSQLEQIQSVMLKYLGNNLPADFVKAFTKEQSLDVIAAIFKQYN